MPIHIWEFLTALYKRSKWFAVLSAASTLSLPFPFLGTHALWTIAVVALFSFVAANFRLYMDQQPEIERLSARGKGETPKSDLQLTAGAPRFTVSDATDGSVRVWADCFLECTNVGLTTTISFTGRHTPGIPTRDELRGAYLVFGKNRSELYPQLRIDSRAAGVLRCHMGIAIERKDWANPKTVTIKVSLKEAFSGAIETYTFADLNETTPAAK